jgi:hypothetical protein
MCGLIGALLVRPTLTNERMAAALTTIVHRGPVSARMKLSAVTGMALPVGACGTGCDDASAALLAAASNKPAQIRTRRFFMASLSLFSEQ